MDALKSPVLIFGLLFALIVLMGAPILAAAT